MNILIYDIEVFGDYFLFCAQDEKTKEKFAFEVSWRKNEIDTMIKFIEDYKDYHFVGFNNIRYDSQVVEYIIRNNQYWIGLGYKEITEKIKDFSNEIIDGQDYDEFPAYWERDLHFKQIDLMKIHHYDNKHRRASLKWIAFMMNSEDIEELPFHHYKTDFTEGEIEKVIAYCYKDIANTYRFYLYTVGETDNEIYKGKNKIQDRLDIIEELEFPKEALNFSDVKIGDEINKRGYCAIKGITTKKLYEIRRRRKPTRKMTFGDCIPEYVTFESPELKNFFEKVRKAKVNLTKDTQEFPIRFRSTTYVVAQGGIHTNESPRVVIPKKDEILRDADVGSQHPTAIVKRKLYPEHLGPEWLINYDQSIKVRMQYKDRAEKEPRMKGLSEMYKLALNGGGFGKTIDKRNWQYGPEVGFACTIGNQFEILMLAERFELAGIKVISANTDGVLCLFHNSLENKYKEICTWWEETVGNSKQGKLEFADFEMIAQESVNCYVAIKKGSKLKVKGRLAVDSEVHKNNTKDLGRIERKAIVDFFHKNIPISETIMKSRNIFDFCIGVKSSKDYHYESVSKDGAVTEHKKILRFFMSKDGEKLYKIKNEDSEGSGVDMSRIANGASVKIFNTKVDLPWEEYKIDYDFYINNAEEVLSKITGNKIQKDQLSLF